jgi:hypothetical protein
MIEEIREYIDEEAGEEADEEGENEGENEEGNSRPSHLSRSVRRINQIDDEDEGDEGDEEESGDMNDIVNHIYWEMQKGQTPDIRISRGDDGYLPATEEELQTILHPSGPWKVIAKFDYRANANESEDDPSPRIFTFPSNTTLRQFANWVIEGPCYGYFEGLDFRNGKYEISWGT